MTSPEFDCLSCGACCFGGHDRYVRLLPEDATRALPPEALTQIGDTRYMRMADGHCAQLSRRPEGLACAVYDQRPTACRAFRAGSFECLMSRRHRGSEAAGLGRAAAAVVQIGALSEELVGPVEGPAPNMP